jgi:hypothetical protein
MSDDLRRAYLIGGPHSLYGNLPGDNPDISEQTPTSYGSAAGTHATSYAFAAVPRPFEYHHDHWNSQRDSNRYSYNTQPLKQDGSLNLQHKDWSGTTYMLAPCPKPTDSKMSNLWYWNMP